MKLGRTFIVVIALFVSSASLRADIVSAIAKIKPSVVIIGTYKTTSNPRFNLRGAGFVVGDGNLLVTNAHVLQATSDEVEGADLVIQTRDRRNELVMRQVTVIEVDKIHDLALLKFDGVALAPLALRDSSVREGQSIAFTGFPIGGALGFLPVTHRGMISSITPLVLPAPTDMQLNERAIRSLRDGSFDIYQLDATAYPGNSGGPMFDENTGEILGVVSMAFVKRTKESALSEPSGISYAVPIKYAIQLLQRRKAN
jgi:serine protease Do